VNLLSGQRETLKIALERDPDAALWRKPSKFVVEAAGFFGIAPVFGGDVESRCRGACSRPPGLGALAAAYGGYELGSGIGFGITAGYFFTERTFRDRAVEAIPMGLAPKKGQADETLRLTGVMLGAAAGLRLGEKVPFSVRVGVGGLLGRVGDSRQARFPVGDNTSFNEIADTRAVNHLYLAPEARVGLRLGDRVELGAGLTALVLIALSSPKWGEDQPRPVVLSDVGYSEYPREAMVGRISLLFAPGISARYAF
jgi:hypothetical protein